MTATDLRSTAAPTSVSPAIQRRRPLPGGRAVLGGFLVAVAAVGIFAAYQQASQPARTSYVAAARALVAGRAIVAQDLTTVAAALPDGTKPRVFTSVRAVVGRVLTADVGLGELLQRSSLAPNPLVLPNQAEVSFTVDPSRSLGDRLGPGDVVDVLATVEGETGVLARGVRIVDRQPRGGGGFIYTVGLSDQLAIEAVVGANVDSTLSVVRTEAGPPSAPTGPSVNAPSSPGASATVVPVGPVGSRGSSATTATTGPRRSFEPGR